ncbi:MAG: hypothetical protein HRU15_07895, partial [Planctomycetes bacterium]|nr:hypothetical protein [Planctomycetota bacterium]
MHVLARVIIVSVLFMHISHAVEAVKPWTDEWSMDLRGVERWFVEYEKNNYLETIEADLDDLQFLVNKDVLIQGKFKQIQNNGIELYNYPTLRMGGNTELWSTIIDGDNVYVLGKVRSVNAQGELIFQNKFVLRAPSDAIVIANKLSEIDESDLDARVKFAAWVRKAGKNMGNRNVWMTAADNIVDHAITELSAQAERQKDVGKLLKAMKWSTDGLSDSKRAAKLGSSAWISEIQGDHSQQVKERMSKLGLTTLNGQWMTKREKVIKEFTFRLADIGANDAKAYYDLALNIAKYRDVLPEALELKHKALQQGFLNNPRSNILRRALGKETIEESDKKTADANEFSDGKSGFVISPPEKWIRAKEAMDGDVTWLDPSSTTAYISLTVLNATDIDNFAELFAARMQPYSERIGYSPSAEESLGLGSASKLVHFSFLEGNDRRLAKSAMVFFMRNNTVIYVYASYIKDDAAHVDKALSQIINVMGSFGDGDADSEEKNANSADVPEINEPSESRTTPENIPKFDVEPDGLVEPPEIIADSATEEAAEEAQEEEAVGREQLEEEKAKEAAEKM